MHSTAPTAKRQAAKDATARIIQRAWRDFVQKRVPFDGCHRSHALQGVADMIHCSGGNGLSTDANGAGVLLQPAAADNPTSAPLCRSPAIMMSRVDAWRAFALRQTSRYVRPPPAQTQHHGRAVEHVLRVLRVHGLPSVLVQSLLTPEVQLQLRVSLFDEIRGAFYGATACSQGAPVACEEQELEAWVMLSAANAARCTALLELVAVRPGVNEGRPSGHISLGWATLVPADAQGKAGTRRIAPLMRGTPRYLLLRCVHRHLLAAKLLLLRSQGLAVDCGLPSTRLCARHAMHCCRAGLYVLHCHLLLCTRTAGWSMSTG